MLVGFILGVGVSAAITGFIYATWWCLNPKG